LPLLAGCHLPPIKHCVSRTCGLLVLGSVAVAMLFLLRNMQYAEGGMRKCSEFVADAILAMGTSAGQESYNPGVADCIRSYPMPKMAASMSRWLIQGP